MHANQGLNPKRHRPAFSRGREQAVFDSTRGRASKQFFEAQQTPTDSRAIAFDNLPGAAELYVTRSGPIFP